MRAAGIGVFIAAALLLAAPLRVTQAQAQDRKSIPPRDKDNPLTELISGYYYTPLRLQALQDDDFDNPGFPWVNQGERLWNQIDGTAGKACVSCHGGAPGSQRAIALGYPKYQEAAKAVVSLEQQINMCRQEKMKASLWPEGAETLVGLTAYLKMQARGAPVEVQIDGPARDTFERGKALYNSRVGQFGMSCAHCHNDHYGDNYRAEVLSQGHSNGFPAFQSKTGTFISLHERFRTCYRDMRAEAYNLGSPELVALELYLAWRGKGLPIETPAVRR
jgi:sulfur-oxidizing protein SoxA